MSHSLSGTYKVDSVLWEDGTTTTSSNKYSFKLGKKRYELSNHLGNVSTTISDRKLVDVQTNGIITAYKADVQSVSDYYPFGKTIPERAVSKNRYHFNGKETDQESGYQDYGAPPKVTALDLKTNKDVFDLTNAYLIGAGVIEKTSEIVRIDGNETSQTPEVQNQITNKVNNAVGTGEEDLVLEFRGANSKFSFNLKNEFDVTQNTSKATSLEGTRMIRFLKSETDKALKKGDNFDNLNKVYNISTGRETKHNTQLKVNEVSYD